MGKRHMICAFIAAIVLIMAGCGAIKNLKTEYPFDYYLFTPENKKDMPLVIVFHGYSEAANSRNTKIVTTMTNKESQAKRPCYLLAPAIDDKTFLAESERDALYKSVKEIADSLIAKGEVDPTRIYVMGNSFGGLATVEFLEKYPEAVAGSIVMCPALTYSQSSTANLSAIKDIPVWFAHAENDNVIPVDVSRVAVFTLESMGAKDVRLTEFSDSEMLESGALIGYHQADFAVMNDESFTEWLFTR